MVNQYHLDIQQIYLDNIKKGFKKHEYRLGTAKRRKVKINDELILTSATNENYKITVIVKDIAFYDNWEEALINYWQDDFNGIYHSLEECIKACSKFYTPQEIKQNQIIVYTIMKK